MPKDIVLPSNVEAERAVLGAMLIDTDALSVGIGSLTVDSFSDVDLRNKAVFQREFSGVLLYQRRVGNLATLGAGLLS